MRNLKYWAVGLSMIASTTLSSCGKQEQADTRVSRVKKAEAVAAAAAESTEDGSEAEINVRAAGSGNEDAAGISQIDHIELTPRNVYLDVGREIQLRAVAILKNGAAQDVTSLAQWKMLDEAVIQMSSLQVGLVKGLVAGSGRIQVSVGQQYADASIKVVEPTLVQSATLPLQASTSLLEFGSVAVGSFSGTRTLTVTNPNNSMVVFTFPNTVADYPEMFVPVGSSSSLCIFRFNVNLQRYELPALASCSIDLQYRPKAAVNSNLAVKLAIPATANSSGALTQVTLSGMGVAAAPVQVAYQPLQASAAQIDFGAIAVGSFSATRTLTITNPNNSMVVFTFPNAVAAYPAMFVPVGASSTLCIFRFNTALQRYELPAQASCTIDLQYRPLAAINSNFVLKLAITATSNSNEALTQVTLLGMGVNAAPAQVAYLPLQASASQVDFGSITVGSSSATRTLTVTNPNNTMVVFTFPNAVAAYPGMFVPVGASSTLCIFRFNPAQQRYELPAQTSCTIDLQYRPSAAISSNFALKLIIPATANSSEVLSQVSLYGMGVNAAPPQVAYQPLQASTSQIDFGSVTVGAFSSTRTLTISNPNNAMVVFKFPNTVADYPQMFVPVGAASTSCVFRFNSSLQRYELPALASCTIDLQYRPTAAVFSNFALKLSIPATANSNEALTQVSLSGTGTNAAPPQVNYQPLQASTSQIDFGSVSVGSFSPTRTLTITNPNSTMVVFTFPNSVAAFPGMFVPVGAASTLCIFRFNVALQRYELPALASCTIDLQFRPSTRGNASYTVKLAIPGSATNSELATQVVLKGNGI